MKATEINTLIKEKEISYSINISLETSNILIKISQKDSVPSLSYSAKYTLEDLIKQSRYFKLFEKPEELMPEFSNLFKEKKIALKRKNTSMILILYLPLRVIEEVHLTIPQEEIDAQKIIADLCQTVNELKQQIKVLSSTQISVEQLNNNLKSKDILLNEEEKNMVSEWILETMKSKEKKINMTLLYKLTRDGDSSSTFHSYCNSKGYTLTLIRNTRGYRCGGFTTQSWGSRGSNVNDSNAFLFSLEFKEKYPSYDGSNAIYDHGSYGPTFGSTTDLCIANGCFGNNSSQCNFPYYYCGTRARALSGGSNNFRVNELEVYQINIV